MKRSEKKRPVDPRTLPPIRIKKCPPTIQEAIIAAQGLADDIDGQVEIAAGFMGVSAEEVRPLVVQAFQEEHSVEKRVISDRRGAERAVIVERTRTRTPISADRARPNVIVERTRPRIQLTPRVRTFDLTRGPAAAN
ncbi:MAG: hypothetical protein JWN93_1749 [Hyphomicrobiales bacterium]|nr:hypothetical protein [Hyphomicrobiales bacterium]